MKRRYWERKNSQICVLCGKENDTGKVFCPGCRAERNEQQRKDRQFYAGLGLCHKCGRNRIFGSEGRCPECRAKESANVKKKDKDRQGKGEEQRPAA